jgi:DNA-binding response OmpR family regulator
MKAQTEQISPIEAKPRILVIEDELQLSRLLLIVLKRGGFAACAAATGTDGLRLTEEQKFDLILSDIDLPDIDGFEICRRIKQNPKLRHVPIILMSGRLAEGNVALALTLGAIDYVSKPFRVETILSKISAHICGANGAPSPVRPTAKSLENWKKD